VFNIYSEAEFRVRQKNTAQHFGCPGSESEPNTIPSRIQCALSNMRTQIQSPTEQAPARTATPVFLGTRPDDASHRTHRQSPPHHMTTALDGGGASSPPASKGKARMDAAEDWTCGICLAKSREAIRGELDCCAHHFCFFCIMSWARVESRCPFCKARFRTIRPPPAGSPPSALSSSQSAIRSAPKILPLLPQGFLGTPTLTSRC
jgi:hypothetical protein